MYRSVLLVLMGLMVCGPAFSEENEESATMMKEVVVTASRQEEPVSRVPANVTIVTADQIEQSTATTVPELLRSVPGVLVADIASNGRNYTVDLRGFGESAPLNTLVLVDGRRINQADLSGADWALIPKDRVERIEVVRGGRGSVLYGENATGGVINIITKKGKQVSSTTGSVLAGSYETFLGDVSASGTTGNLSFAVNGNYRTTDGYRDNSDTESKDLGANFEYTVSESLFLNLSGGFHDDESSLPGALRKSDLAGGASRRDTLHPDNYADTQDWYLQGGFQYYLNDASYLETKIATRQRDWRSFSFFDGGDYDSDTQIETFSFSPQLVLNEKFFGVKTNVLLGFDYENSKQDINNVLNLPDPMFPYFSDDYFELSREYYGYFAHAEVFLVENLAVSGGARKSRAEFDFEADTNNTFGSAQYSDGEILDEENYTFGLNYRLEKNASLYSSYSRSSRFPVLDEFFSYTNSSVNSDLRAQKTDSYEAGLRMQLDSGLAFSVNLFRFDTKDEIFYNPVGGALGFGANENLDGDTIRQGVELTASKELYDILLTGSYTYRDTEIEGGQYDGKDIPNVPDHQWTLGGQKTFDCGLQLGVSGTYVGERRFISDFDNSRDKLDDYFYVTSKLTYLLDNGSVYLAVNNLLDEEYSEYGVLSMSGEEAFYPSPEINFLVGAQLEF